MQQVFVSKQKAKEFLQTFANEKRETSCVYRVIYGPNLEKEDFTLRKMSDVLDPNSDRIEKKCTPVIKVAKPRKTVVESKIQEPMFPKVRIEIENLWHTLIKPQPVLS